MSVHRPGRSQVSSMTNAFVSDRSLANKPAGRRVTPNRAPVRTNGANLRAQHWLFPLPDSATSDPNMPLTQGGAIPGLAPNSNPPISLALISPLMKLHYAYARGNWALIDVAGAPIGEHVAGGGHLGGTTRRARPGHALGRRGPASLLNLLRQLRHRPGGTAC
jgi:hypothetical protein